MSTLKNETVTGNKSGEQEMSGNRQGLPVSGPLLFSTLLGMTSSNFAYFSSEIKWERTEVLPKRMWFTVS